jgi:hypothetical protein
MRVEPIMADPAGRNASKIAPKIVLVFVLLNLVFLLTELTINVLGAILPL